MNCDLCNTPYKSMNRMGGLNVCDPCVGGLAGHKAKARGWLVEEAEWVVQVKNNITYYGRVVGVINKQSPLQLTLRPKTGLWSLLGLVTGQRSGDPLFDRMVYASTRDAGPVQAWFRHDGVQSAIMDLLGDRAVVYIAGDRVEVNVAQGEPVVMNRLVVETMVLMTYVQRFAAQFEGETQA